jgi:hypothetical protein
LDNTEYEHLKWGQTQVIQPEPHAEFGSASQQAQALQEDSEINSE